MASGHGFWSEFSARVASESKKKQVGLERSMNMSSEIWKSDDLYV